MHVVQASVSFVLQGFTLPDACSLVCEAEVVESVKGVTGCKKIESQGFHHNNWINIVPWEWTSSPFGHVAIYP